jgi:hypothetical protein
MGSAEIRAKEKRSQIIRVRIDPQTDVSTLPPIATIWATAGNKLLTPEAGGTIPTIPSLCINFDMIDKHSSRIGAEIDERKALLIPIRLARSISEASGTIL